MFLRFLMCITAATLAMAPAFAQTTRTAHLPPFGLGSTETARFSLTNTATAATNGTAASCTGSVAFFNAAGVAIGNATNFTIASGATSSVSLPFANSTLTGVRGEIRAVLTVTRPATAAPPCSLLFALETFDSGTGATHLYLNGSEEFGGRGDR
jgi:hypothetical protein